MQALAVALAAFAEGAGDWGLRNAASQLFTGLLSRAFGVPRVRDHANLTAQKDAKMGLAALEFFTRYKPLLKAQMGRPHVTRHRWNVFWICSFPSL